MTRFQTTALPIERDAVAPDGSDVRVLLALGTHFQFRSFGDAPLAAIGVTMPPWPGDGEAVIVSGEWAPTVP